MLLTYAGMCTGVAELMASTPLLTFLQAGHRVVVIIFSFSLPNTCIHTYLMHTFRVHSLAYLSKVEFYSS